MKFLLPLFVLDLCLIFVDARTLCKDMNNEEVDWFVFYKMPKQTWSSDANVAAGTGFIYLDSNNKKWQQQTVGLDSLNQAIAYTMQAYYNNPSNNRLFHVLYNDEIPDSTVWSDTSGHTKGAAVFDTLYGFWLIHSLPRFLNNASYEFPSNAHRYGQAGICVSLNYEDSFPNLAMQLYNTNPFIYSSFLPPKMEYDAPLMRKVLNGQRSDEEPYYSVNSFICTNGASFKHFAKEGKFNADLYHDLVAPSIADSMVVESWLHESVEDKNLFSNCSNGVDVYNAKYVKLPFFDVKFANYWDHSKYAVANGATTNPWVCIGDINRQTHQEKRGGGTMCLMDTELHTAFSEIVSEYYKC